MRRGNKKRKRRDQTIRESTKERGRGELIKRNIQ